jgi:para-aminobenzoate synthetase component 1
MQVVPRLRTFPLDGWVDPADAFVALFAGLPDAVWLDAGPDAVSGASYLASGERVATFSLAERAVSVNRGASKVRVPGTMLDFLRADLDSHGRLEPRTAEPSFALGWVGWLGYESGAAACGVPVAATEGPDAAMLFADRALAFDHERRTVELLALDSGHGAEVESWVAQVRSVLGTASGAAAAYREAHPLSPVPSAATWRHDDADYLRMIADCQEAIRNGDAYQLCLTNQARAEFDLDDLALQLRLREASPAHHGGLLRIAGLSLVSSSPEQFLAVRSDGRVRTKPIKGTRPRGATVARDVELRAELEASEKERAENVMIVDLMRNDLGRVCQVGSVEVHHLLDVESYAQVHQLVSTVEGRLLDGLGAVDAIGACFPAGSMTGAPKLSAMRILHGLERGERGIYSGCFGYLGLDGAADLAMVIRSITVRPGRVTIGAGGGITALSVPEEELEEVAIKARALFSAAGLLALGNGSAPSNV